jgi:hypothetical protein
MSEYRNIGGLSSTGKIDGSINGLPYSARVSIAGTYYWGRAQLLRPVPEMGRLEERHPLRRLRIRLLQQPDRRRQQVRVAELPQLQRQPHPDLLQR